MFDPPSAIVTILSIFLLKLFPTCRSRSNAELLLYGAILTKEEKTISNILRILGLQNVTA